MDAAFFPRTARTRRRRRAPARAAAAAARTSSRAGRLLVFWSSPQHRCDAGLDAWVQEELARAVGDEALRDASLTRLRPASPTWTRPWDWMLEFEVGLDAEGRPVVPQGWDAWLGDLRRLGMRPTAMVAEPHHRPHAG